MSAPNPTAITLHQKSAVLEVSFDDGKNFRLSCEYLRVYSPSAEVRGHGPGQEVLVYGKAGVNIVTLEPVGNYAVRPTFSDGHSTGIFSWDYLYQLGVDEPAMWRRYLERLSNEGRTRKAASE